MLTDIQLHMIDRQKQLKKIGVTVGKRQVHWVHYEDGYREYYLSAFEANKRADEITAARRRKVK